MVAYLIHKVRRCVFDSRGGNYIFSLPLTIIQCGERIVSAIIAPRWVHLLWCKGHYDLKIATVFLKIAPVNDSTIKTYVLRPIRKSISCSYFPFQVLIYQTKCRVRESAAHNFLRSWLWRMMLLVWINSSPMSTRTSASIPMLSSDQTCSTHW